MSVYERQLEEQNSQLQQELAVAEDKVANIDKKRILIIHPQDDGVVDLMKLYIPMLQFIDLVLIYKGGQFFESFKDRYNKQGTLYTFDEVRKMYE